MFRFSPIIIFSYNRKTKLNNLIKSLKKNKEFKYSKIYIYQDFYKPKENDKNIKKVKNTIFFLKKIKETNFKIVFRNKNFGLAKNIILGVTEILKIHKSAIILEDDLIVSKNFLNFMNKSLNFYKNKKKVWHINGWSFNIFEANKLEHDNYFLSFPSSWGWGTWQDRWKYFEKNSEKILKKENPTSIKKFNLDNSYNFFSQIERNRKQTIDTWAIFWYYSIFKKKKLCVYPKKNLILNNGFNKNATNTKYPNTLFDNKILCKKINVDYSLNNICKENFEISKKIKLKMKINRLFFILKRFF